MKYRDLTSSLFWTGVGVIFCIGAFKYGLFRSGIPGAGFFPFIGSLVLICLSLTVLVFSICNKGGESKIVPEENRFPERENWNKLVFTLLALFAYGIGLKYLGYLLTTFLFMILLLKLVEPQRWITALTFAFLTPAASYMVFEVFLKVRLPKGVWGI